MAVSSLSCGPANLANLSSKCDEARSKLEGKQGTLATYTATRADLEASAKSLFKMVKSGKVKIAIDQRYPLAEAAQAHIDLESRKTTGQTILVP